MRQSLNLDHLFGNGVTYGVTYPTFISSFAIVYIVVTLYIMWWQVIIHTLAFSFNRPHFLSVCMVKLGLYLRNGIISLVSKLLVCEAGVLVGERERANLVVRSSGFFYVTEDDTGTHIPKGFT